MGAKVKFPLPEVVGLAGMLQATLAHYCERLQVVGSVRRARPRVSDLEVLFIPGFESRADGLFDTTAVDLADEFLTRWLSIGGIGPDMRLEKRLSKTGVPSWGPKNKLAVLSRGDFSVPVDFFATDADGWFVSLVIRTGPADLNVRLASGALKRGLKLHAYGVFEDASSGKRIVPRSEREVFDLCGEPYRAPELRDG
jgi:DNA polymerase/3'-5' exonuclease PolX